MRTQWRRGRVTNLVSRHREHSDRCRSKSDVKPSVVAIGFTAMRFLIPARCAMQSSHSQRLGSDRSTAMTFSGFDPSIAVPPRDMLCDYALKEAA